MAIDYIRNEAGDLVRITTARLFRGRKRRMGRPRVHTMPKVGDEIGGRRVLAIRGRGHQRSDLILEIECLHCGRRAEAYEFNLRKARARCRFCKHNGPR